MRDDVLRRAEGGEAVIGQALAGVARLYAVPPLVSPLLVAGVVLGAVGDALLRAPGPPGLNLSLWVASVAVAALALHRRAALALDRERAAWLVIGVVVRGRTRVARRSAAEAARAWLRDVDLRARGPSSRRGLGASRGRASIRRRAGAGRTARVDGRGACARGCDAISLRVSRPAVRTGGAVPRPSRAAS